MSSERDTRRAVRFFFPWNDEKEERWLMEQARAGWRVTGMGCLSYAFERAEPAEMAYRFDVRPSRRHDLEEYLSLFRDAGWEHVGRRGLWYLFRKPVEGGVVPEIYTDNKSRIRKYQRILAFLAVMMIVCTSGIATRGEHWGLATWFQMSALFLFLYFIARLAWRMRTLRNAPAPQG